MTTRLIILLCLFGAPFRARGDARVFESGPTRVHLIELFTSEGCSSCPPAESWLSKLKNDPGLWKNFVPVTFHVDYWDRLGWKDPFASKKWTERQYRYSTNWRNESVYTPGFVLNGKEWPGFVIPAAITDKPGVLKVVVDEEKIAAEFHGDQQTPADLQFHFARLLDGDSSVNAGENRGRKLHHDFVVESLVDHKMIDGRVEFQGEMQKDKFPAFAAWVTAPDELTPIQVTGGWLR